jgi:hypothetical protein
MGRIRRGGYIIKWFIEIIRRGTFTSKGRMAN